MNDLISRKAAIEAVYQGLKKPSNDETLQRILDNLKQIPVIDCAKQWIPVSEPYKAEGENDGSHDKRWD